jgi:hypothetical protein
MVQIKRIGIKQTAKVISVFYFLISLVFVLPISLIAFFLGSLGGKEDGFFATAFGGIILLLLPLFYALMGFVMVALTALIYNALAKRIGGIEIELDSETTPKPS